MELTTQALGLAPPVAILCAAIHRGYGQGIGDLNASTALADHTRPVPSVQNGTTDEPYDERRK
jgi:hypothetical protein